MSKVQVLRGLVNQRLTAAAEEIFELFERTIAEYEEQLRGTKEKQHKLQDSVYNPEVQLQRADVQQLFVRKEEVPHEQQERSYSLGQEDPPGPLYFEKELWSSQEGEQLQRLEEEDIRAVRFTPVPVKREEDDGEEPQSSQLHEEIRDTEGLKTEAGGEDCGGSEPHRIFNPDRHLKPVTDEETSRSKSETDDSCDLEEMPQSGSNPLTGETSASSSECAANPVLKKPNTTQRKEKPFSCSICGTRFTNKKSLFTHMYRHRKGECYSCSVCKKMFPIRGELAGHMRIHTGEKPFICSVCGKSFTHSSNLYQHQLVHTGEKPFGCSVCGKRFTQKSNMNKHLQVHMGEKPFSCSFCGKRFTQKWNMYKHQEVHTQ